MADIGLIAGKSTAIIRGLGCFILLAGGFSFPAGAQTSFWNNGTTPQTPGVPNDSAAVTLGLKFYSDVAGALTGIRFYKGPNNTGTHVGTLWTSGGIKLASVTFSGESASGWQQANFAAPVSISANTTYVISYLAPNGNYADDQSYAWSAVSASPLHVSGSAPGVYAYGTTTTFPTGTWSGSNYWVDVVFTSASTSSPTGAISGTLTGGSGASIMLGGASTATTTADSSGNYSFAGITNGTYTVTPSKPGYTFTPPNQTITVSGNSVANVNFTATGASSIWTGTAVPGTTQVTNDNSSVTLGLTFYSDVAGSVTGVRFYKGSNNTGTHVGTLWSSSGAALATVTFSGETPSGWQQANFSQPVAIAASTTYVISYLAPNGSYAADQYYSWAALSASPLHVSGSSPGVFAYGAGANFPTGTWNATNYWVDLVFVPSSTSTPNPPPPPATTYSISGTVTGSAATVTLSGTAAASTTTDSTGKYSFAGLVNGTYLVAPSQAGFVFTPSTSSVTVSSAAVSGVNFTATALLPHTVTLTWNASVSPNVVGYNAYRSTNTGGPYVKINSGLLGALTYVDSGVTSGYTYYYVTTAVDSSNNESGYSNEATAVVPVP